MTLDEKREAEKRPIFASRFEGAALFRARLFRALNNHGIAPPVARQMRPSEVAAILRLDELDEVIAGEQPVKARSIEAVPPPPIPEWVDPSVPRHIRMAGKETVVLSGGDPN